MKTKVIFRFWQGSVIALMPELAADMTGIYCTSYQHIGQHGAAHPLMIMRASRPATEEEYRTLLCELENNYEYDLQVIHRLPRDAYQTRQADTRGGQGL